ncbi:MAG: hypothetical protein WDA16_00615 [Candidatus Thermoplasmatota archaeon]
MPGFKPTKVAKHLKAKPEYDRIEAAARAGRQPQQAIWKSLQTALLRVRADGQAGEPIPKRSIPQHFVASYGAENLYCFDLANFYRCFYTIVGREVIFLDIVDHGQYDKWFE